MSLFSKILWFRWRTTTSTTDIEHTPPLEQNTIATEGRSPENPTTPLPATPARATSPTMLTQLVPATIVGLRASDFMIPPSWARPAHEAVVERFYGQVRYFRQTGINIGRFVLSSVIDLAPQRVGANEDGVNGVYAPPQDMPDSSRHRWLWFTVKLVAVVTVVGAIALATTMLPRNRTFYRELLEVMRRVA